MSSCGIATVVGRVGTLGCFHFGARGSVTLESEESAAEGPSFLGTFGETPSSLRGVD